MKKWYKVLIVELLILVSALNFKNSIFISFLWIIFHEIAHMLVANIFNCRFNNFGINILGAKAEFVDIDELSEKKKLYLYASGPTFNIFIAIIMYFLYGSLKDEFILESILINICLGIFNLLPAYPLDGSRICEILLCRKFLYKESKKITEIISFIIAAILFLIFNIMLVLHRVNISLFLTTILITYTTFIEKERTMYIIMGDMIKKVRKIRNHEYIENKSISIYYKKGLVNVLTLVDKNKFNTFFILDDNMKLLEIIHEDELIQALKDYGNITLEEYIKLKK